MPRKALNDRGEEKYQGNPRNTRALVGRRIAERRREMNLTQSDLGESIGVSRETISKYETGSLDVSAGDLPVLALKLRVPIIYFFSGLPQERGWGELAHDVDYAQPFENVCIRDPGQLRQSYEDKKRYAKILDGMGELSHLEETMFRAYRRLSGDQQIMAYAMVLGLLDHAPLAPPSSRRVIAHGMVDAPSEARAEVQKKKRIQLCKPTELGYNRIDFRCEPTSSPSKPSILLW